MKFAYWGSHPVFTEPPPDAKLWRYLSFAKLVSMLETGTLHFARTDKLNDPFEGSGTKRRPPFAEKDEQGEWRELTPEETAPLVAHETPELREATWKTQRESMAVNCWYMGEHESAAMWLLYASDGIAVETTFERFISSIPQGTPGDGTHSIQAGLVRYIDYETDIMPPSNAFWPFVHKRLSFAHEQEFRAVIHEMGEQMVDHGRFQIREPGVPPEGFQVPVDVAKLIGKVHVAPTSAAWFADAVRALVQRFGFAFSVEQSQLDRTPIY